VKDDKIMSKNDIEYAHERIRSNIRKLHEKKGKSQLEMALAIGHTSAAFYAKAERGIQNKKFNIEHLCKIAKVLDVDICEFFEGL